MFKEASRVKLRFNTQNGVLSVEDLWDLSLEQLDELAIALEAEYKQNKKAKSFIQKKTAKDKTAKLRFDIVLEVLNTKLDEKEASLDEAKRKEESAKIMAILAKKKEEELANLSVEELEKKLKQLSK